LPKIRSNIISKNVKQKEALKMENTLEIQLHETGELIPVKDGSSSLGVEMESGATTLQIDLPASAFGMNHYLEFVKPDGTAVSSAPLIETTSAAGIHSISLSAGNTITDIAGRYTIQYVARSKDSTPKTLKSKIIYLDIDPSTNAVSYITESDPDFIAWATKQIAELTAKVGGLDSDESDDPATKQELGDESIRAQGAELDNADNLALETERAEGVESAHSLSLADHGNRIKTLEDLIISNTFFYGIKFYDGETTGDRLGSAVGLQSGVNGGANDFDHMPIFKDITTYTDASGNKIVKVGKAFYCKRFHNGTPGNSGYWFADCISPYQIDSSWGLHYAFLDKNGANRGYFTIGAYFASKNVANTKLVTVSGAVPATAMTPTAARALAATGSAHLAENRKFDALTLLFRIEFATNNGQGVFKGISDITCLYPGDYAAYQPAGSGNIMIFPCADWFSGDEAAWAAAFKVGASVNVWDDNGSGFIGEVARHVTAITFATAANPTTGVSERQVHITISGSAINLQNENEYYANIQNYNPFTGQCDNLSGSSAEVVSSYQGVRAFSYRGIENLWGEFWQFADGVCFVTHYAATTEGISTKRFECFDPSHYDEIGVAWTTNVERASNLLPHWIVSYTYYAQTAPSGWIMNFADYPVSDYYGMDVALSGAGSDLTYIPDYVYIPNPYTSPTEFERLFVAYRGGGAGFGSFCGPCFLYGSFDPSNDDSGFGFRLSYDPS
jgi:hypothetical protein